MGVPPQQAGIANHQFADALAVGQRHRSVEGHLRTAIEQQLGDGGKSLGVIVARIGGARGAVERGQALDVALANVGPLAQQPLDHLLVRRLRSGVQRRPAGTVASAHQRAVRLQKTNGRAVVARADRLVDLVLDR